MEDTKKIDPMWKLADPLTVVQAAALAAGVDPNLLEQDGEKILDGRVNATFKALTNAITAGKLMAKLRYGAEPRHVAGIDNLIERSYWKNEEVIEVGKGDNTYVISATPDWNLTFIEVANLTTWFDDAGIYPSFFFPQEKSKKNNSAPTIKGDAHATLSVAIARFPEEYPEHRSQPPKLDAEIRPWLERKYNCSQRMAHVFGTIISEHFGLNN